ncbi:hypothetical protein GIB67_001384, partial [Kingdonia uniflora]
FPQSQSVELHQPPTVSSHQTYIRRNIMNPFEPSKEIDHQGGQTLSLTLGSHLPSQYTSQEFQSFATVVGNSRYLKPTQSLLNEVVSSGGKDIDVVSDRYISGLICNGRKVGLSPALQAELYENGFSSAPKDEAQVRIAGLLGLLDEVEIRYERYYHQMEEVVRSFELVAGLGAAKPYSALALQAMAKHFSKMRDRIIVQVYKMLRQIRNDLPKFSTGFSQLSLSDQETRQRRVSLQMQLGMMVQNQRQVWRQTRGLPDYSVGTLRVWLFEHILHPYPTESEKQMLASQTGLTKIQVSNWFINARVRVWKPMIEEIYREEFSESDSSTSESVNKSAPDPAEI